MSVETAVSYIMNVFETINAITNESYHEIPMVEIFHPSDII
jgi:hypothetical protein